MKEYTLNTFLDLINFIIQGMNDTDLDIEISKLEELTTITQVFMSRDDIPVDQIINYENDGTGYWDYTVTYGDSVAVDNWKTDHYANLFKQASRSSKNIIFEDNYNTELTTRESLELYNNLGNKDNSTSISITYDDSSKWLVCELPDPKTINIIKLNIDEDNIRCYFGFSNDYINWVYFSATSTHSTNELTKYLDPIDAETNYILLSSGLNSLILPELIQMKYGKLFFVFESIEQEVNINSFIFNEQVQIEDLAAGTINTGLINILSPDGRTTFNGNTITIRDENGTIRVELGLLS